MSSFKRDIRTFETKFRNGKRVCVEITFNQRLHSSRLYGLFMLLSFVPEERPDYVSEQEWNILLNYLSENHPVKLKNSFGNIEKASSSTETFNFSDIFIPVEDSVSVTLEYPQILDRIIYARANYGINSDCEMSEKLIEEWWLLKLNLYDNFFDQIKVYKSNVKCVSSEGEFDFQIVERTLHFPKAVFLHAYCKKFFDEGRFWCSFEIIRSLIYNTLFSHIKQAGFLALRRGILKSHDHIFPHGTLINCLTEQMFKVIDEMNDSQDNVFTLSQRIQGEESSLVKIKHT